MLIGIAMLRWLRRFTVYTSRYTRQFNQARINTEIMKIFIFACHEGVQESLLREFVKRGEVIYLTEQTHLWNFSQADLPSGVIRGLPDRPDVIAVGSIQDLLVAIKLKLQKRWFKVPVVITHWWFPTKKYHLYHLYRLAWNVSVCEYGKRYLKDLSGIDSDVIYCPVDTEIFRPLDVERDPHLIVIVGNRFASRPVMGWDHLQQILHRMHQQAPEIRFLLIGNNPEIETDHFPNLSKIFLKQNEMPSYLCQAQCAAFTTTFNLIPHSLLGTMAVGLPVVAFDLESLHEVIEDGKSGFLIPRYDIEAFARRLIDLVHFPPSSSFGTQARQNVIAKCDYQTVSTQYEDLFERLL
jgi:glycosyltransferase involved in cell wall biosynthesis